MVCAQCGGEMVGDARFCAHCGAAMVARSTPPGTPTSGSQTTGYPTSGYPTSATQGTHGSGVEAPAGGGYGERGYAGRAAGFAAWAEGARVQRSIRTLGVLWCCFAAYRVMSGLIGMAFLPGVRARARVWDGMAFRDEGRVVAGGFRSGVAGSGDRGGDGGFGGAGGVRRLEPADAAELGAHPGDRGRRAWR